MAEMTIIGILLILVVLLIGLGFAIKHRDRVFADNPVPEPPPRLPWTRRDVALNVCAALCYIGAFFLPDLVGVPPMTHAYTPANVIAVHGVFFVPWLGLQIAIGVRNRRRRKTKKARREDEPREGKDGVEP